jgi:acylglycerol lipase
LNSHCVSIFSMKYEESYFNGKDGSSRFFRTWRPDGQAKATVVICHGYAEHSGRYRELSERFVEAGFAVWAHDHYGHGRSDGPRAFIERIELLVEDLQIAIETVEALYDGVPIFLYGHSMGGLLSALTAAKQAKEETRLAGIIFSAPAVRIMHTSPAIVRAIAGIIRLFAPALALIPFDIDHLSHSSEVIEDYRNDPLNYTGKLKVATGLEMVEGEKMLDAENLAGITAPSLILHGKADKNVPPFASQALYDGISSADKTLRYFEDMYHELHNEECKEELSSLVISWLENHV